jgi:polyhydroxybutyrate depolymerase
VHVPSSYRGSSKVPLVLNMHGSGSTAQDQELFTGMDATADANGFIVAYPQGLIPEGSGFDWNVPGVPLDRGRSGPAHAADDVSLPHAARRCARGALLHRPDARVRDRLLGWGPHRQPARLRFLGRVRRRRARSAACDARRRVRPSGRSRSSPSTGRRTRSIPTAATARRTGPTRFPRPRGTGRQQDGCSTSAATSKPDPGVTLTAYGHCRRQAPWSSCTAISGEGHEWPGGPTLPPSLTRLLGAQSDAISADNVMWAFFAAHPLS